MSSEAQIAVESQAATSEQVRQRRVWRWIVAALIAALLVALVVVTSWGINVQPLRAGALRSVGGSQPVVASSFGEQHVYMAMFREGGTLEVTTDLRNETFVPVTVTGIRWGGPYVDGDCSWRPEEVSAAPAAWPDRLVPLAKGGVVIQPGEQIAVEGQLVMTCPGGANPGSEVSVAEITVDYTILGLIDRTDWVDQGFQVGWAKHSDPQKFIDRHVGVVSE